LKFPLPLFIYSKKPNLEFDSMAPSQTSPLLTIALYAAFYYVGYKIFDYYLEKKKGGKAIKPEYSSNVKFSDIYGLDQAKRNLQEIIDYLRSPLRY